MFVWHLGRVHQIELTVHIDAGQKHACHLRKLSYNGGSSTTLTAPASVCLTYSVPISFSRPRVSLEPYTPPAPPILALILSPRRDANAYSSLTAWFPSPSSSSSPRTLMLGSGTGDDVLHAGLRRVGVGEGLTDARGLAYGCAVHACRSGSRSEFRSCSSRDRPERYWVRTSPRSVRFSSTPYAVFVSSHWCNNAPSVDDTIGDGDTVLLGGCCGGCGFSARPCIFKDGLCIGVANTRVLGGTVCVLEFPLVPL